MTPRENVLNMYHRDGYEHAVVQFSLCPSLWEHYRTIAGDTPFEEYFDYPEGFGIDDVWALQPIPREEIDWTGYYEGGVKPGTHFDLWGVAHEPGSDDAMHMTRQRSPLKNATSLEELQAYPFPEFDEDAIDGMRNAVAKGHAAGKAVMGHLACTIWETAWAIRDMTQLMMDMAMEDEKATFILDAVTDRSCVRARAFVKAGVDILHLGDDVGMQQAIMMSEDMYRTWLKPRLTRVIEEARAVRPDILVHYHSCGYVLPFIDDLREAGVDILNPVQPECMDFADVHAQFGDQLSFSGPLGTQTTMPFGTPDEVRQTVFRNLNIAGPLGGLLCCPTHLLEPEVPWQNIEAYIRACKDYGKAGS